MSSREVLPAVLVLALGCSRGGLEPPADAPRDASSADSAIGLADAGADARTPTDAHVSDPLETCTEQGTSIFSTPASSGRATLVFEGLRRLPDGGFVIDVGGDEPRGHRTRLWTSPTGILRRAVSGPWAWSHENIFSVVAETSDGWLEVNSQPVFPLRRVRRTRLVGDSITVGPWVPFGEVIGVDETRVWGLTAESTSPGANTLTAREAWLDASQPTGLRVTSQTVALPEGFLPNFERAERALRWRGDDLLVYGGRLDMDGGMPLSSVLRVSTRTGLSTETPVTPVPQFGTRIDDTTFIVERYEDGESRQYVVRNDSAEWLLGHGRLAFLQHLTPGAFVARVGDDMIRFDASLPASREVLRADVASGSLELGHAQLTAVADDRLVWVDVDRESSPGNFVVRFRCIELESDPAARP